MMSRPEARGGGELGSAAPASLSGLYAITPDWVETRRLLAATEAILAGGCRILQYRNKSADHALRQEQALALRLLTRRFDARLIINDEVDLAVYAQADGVHLGEDDGELAAARARLGAAAILGASCYHSLDLARRAELAGCDYVAFGGFYASPTKPQAGRGEASILSAAHAATSLPVCAIGGITVENAGPLLAAGADMLAVISALYDAPDPGLAVGAFTRLFELPS